MNKLSPKFMITSHDVTNLGEHCQGPTGLFKTSPALFELLRSNLVFVNNFTGQYVIIIILYKAPQTQHWCT